MKYVMAMAGDIAIPIVFPEEVSHSAMVVGLRADQLVARSAGFVYLDYSSGMWIVSSQGSTSTGLGPHEEDQLILNMTLSSNCNSLDVNNVRAYAELVALKAKR